MAAKRKTGKKKTGTVRGSKRGEYKIMCLPLIGEPCSDVWMNIREGDLIGSSMAAAVKKLKPGLPAHHIKILQAWPHDQLRLLRRTAIQMSKYEDTEALPYIETVRSKKGSVRKIRIELQEDAIKISSRLQVRFFSPDF